MQAGDVRMLSLAEIRAADTAMDAAAGPGHPASALKSQSISPAGVAVAGHEGYFFIGNGANGWERQYRGAIDIEESWSAAWRRVLQRRADEARQRGLSLFNLVIPEKQVVYPDKRWHEPVDGEKRPLRNLMDRLPAELAPYYPAGDLVAARALGPTYHRHNSHWTPSGCAAAVAAFAAHMGVAADFDATPLAYRTHRVQHDLTVHFFDPAPDEDAGALMPCGQTYFDNRAVELTGRHTGASYGVRNPAAPDPRTVMVFGDSFAYDAGLTVALSALFRRVVFLWSKNVDFDEAARHEADIVVWESAERFLATLPAQ